MSEVQFESIMDGYHLTTHARRHSKNEIDFHISLDTVSIKRHNWSKLYKTCQEKGIELYGKGANIIFNIADSEAIIIEQIQAHLTEKIHFLVELKLEPK